MTPKERFMNALLGREVDRVPALSVTQTGTLELMEACGAFWPEAHVKAETMATLALAAHEIAGFEAVRVPFGMYAEAETLGCTVDYHEGKKDFTPTVTKPVSDPSSLRVPSPTEGKMAVIVEAVKLLRKKVGDDVPVIAGIVGPYNLAGTVQGFDLQMRLIITKPEEVERILEITWQVAAEFGNALAEAGADVVTFLEPIVSTIGPVFFGKYALPYLKKAAESIKCPTALHVCGNATPILRQMAESGVKGLSIDQKVSVKEAKALVEGKTTIIGNVDPVKTMIEGKPEDVKRESRRIIEEGIDILAPGCGLSPYTPIANMKAMVEAAEEYGRKKV
ncbi:MtaA/CmuA family methyltransferase [Candidatus Hecatella orcuttiae]|uniref:MtaA/CmuA family methyltransferase n=1 Tax=Candidatus Hecatella orcuttiae TaxID=1935119 RepID=UPI002867E7C2|nr:MtaA/CmuA family methyltransferase [Candidatus Hecatella orcuttiae]